MIILVWTVYVLRKQTEVAAEQTKLLAYQNISAQMVAVDRFFIEHVELRAYIYDDKVISEEDELYPEVLATAEMMMDFMDGVFNMRPYMPEYPWDESWGRYFEDLVDSSPAIRHFIKDKYEWYEPSFRYYPEKVRAKLTELGKKHIKESQPQVLSARKVDSEDEDGQTA